MSKQLFQENDLVYHHEHGQGLLSTDASEPWMYNKVGVKFKNRTDEMIISTELLSFTPYSLEKGGFSQNPINRTKSYNFETNYSINLRNKLNNITTL